MQKIQLETVRYFLWLASLLDPHVTPSPKGIISSSRCLKSVGLRARYLKSASLREGPLNTTSSCWRVCVHAASS